MENYVQYSTVLDEDHEDRDNRSDVQPGVGPLRGLMVSLWGGVRSSTGT